MIRSTLLALDQANKTGNYAVLRGLGGPGLQTLTERQLADMFVGLRNGGIDLSPALVITPELVEVPNVTAEQQLRLSGYFPTEPLRINFQIVYQVVGSAWHPNGMAISMVPSTAARAIPRSVTSPGAQAPEQAAEPNAEAKNRHSDQRTKPER